jgi:hypothetical protein
MVKKEKEERWGSNQDILDHRHGKEEKRVVVGASGADAAATMHSTSVWTSLTFRLCKRTKLFYLKLYNSCILFCITIYITIYKMFYKVRRIISLLLFGFTHDTIGWNITV